MTDRAVFIDIDGLTQARSWTAVPLAIARTLAGAIGLLFACLAWFAIVIWPFSHILNEAVAIPIFIVAGAPFLVVLIVLPVVSLGRWNAGIGTLAAAQDFTAVQLSEVLPYYGVSVRELLERVAAFAKARGPVVRPVTTDKALRLQSTLVRIGALALVVGGITVTAVTSDNTSANAWPTIIAFLLASAAWQFSSKSLQLDAAALLRADRRKLVLLLRSFRDEDIHAYQVVRSPIGKLIFRRRFEQGLAGALTAFGPLIAIGRPGEKLPQIGAARTYLTDAEWQPTVIKWMNDALFIAMIAGATEWIHWELQRILELGHVSRLMILLPPALYRDPARWTNIVKAFEGTTWGEAMADLDSTNLILVQLRPLGGIIAIRKASRPIVQDYQLAIAMAVFEEFGDSMGVRGRDYPAI